MKTLRKLFEKLEDLLYDLYGMNNKNLGKKNK
jgi:hypothetical protein